jgi:hypothetical protein
MNKALLSFTIILILFSACGRPETASGPASESSVEPVLDPTQQKIKERAEQVTRGIQRQKEIKDSIKQMPLLELFTRETVEREVLTKLGEPESIKNLTLESFEQRVFYYNKDKFALWLWREKGSKGPYQYRATMSLNHGKFAMPVHNVFTQEELQLVLTVEQP